MPFMKGRTDVLEQLATEQAKGVQLERIKSELEAKLKEIAVHRVCEGGSYWFAHCQLCDRRAQIFGGEHSLEHKPECLMFESPKVQA